MNFSLSTREFQFTTTREFQFTFQFTTARFQFTALTISVYRKLIKLRFYSTREFQFTTRRFTRARDFSLP